MKFLKTIFLFVFEIILIDSNSQTLIKIDSLRSLLHNAKNDSTRTEILLQMESFYTLLNVDSSIEYGQKALKLAQNRQAGDGEIRALYSLGSALRRKGEIPNGLKLILEGLEIAKARQDSLIGSGYSNLGLIYFDLDEYSKAIENFHEALKYAEKYHKEEGQVYQLSRIAYAYFNFNQKDSTLKYTEKARNKWKTLKLPDTFNALYFEIIGDILFHLGNKQIAFEFLRKSIQLNEMNTYMLTGAIANIVIAGFFKETGQVDSAIYHAKKGLAEAKAYGVTKRVLEASKLLAEVYEPINVNEALYYRKVYDSTSEKFYGAKTVQELQKTISDDQQRRAEIEAKKTAYQNQIKEYLLLGGLIVFLVIAGLLYWNNRQKQKSNKILEKTLSNLKSTQAQLIQSEKMASLGELTAGIAHEIQNPINFISNFSEVSVELIGEMKDALTSGKTSDAAILGKDIEQNLMKVVHHSKRADAIVKGMLQHSRVTTGQREAVDLNALIEEYLKLSYQGWRARDKSFQATIKTDLGARVEKVSVIPQEMGRVLLNLYNNSFYAVKEKKKQAGAEYEPTVFVSSKSMDSKIEIKIKDNGNGIPKNILDKIFQPFFTTKPSGQGTGLGLSLAYDIIKSHGGTLTVESNEGEDSFAEFVFHLPILQ